MIRSDCDGVLRFVSSLLVTWQVSAVKFFDNDQFLTSVSQMRLARARMKSSGSRVGVARTSSVETLVPCTGERKYVCPLSHSRAVPISFHFILCVLGPLVRVTALVLSLLILTLACP